MNPQPPRELFVSERPVRSSDDRVERAYARRRLLTVAALVLAVGGVTYALWGGHATNPADIPTIKAESGYRQKPADPGGIDIPHQDMQVYDQLEGKTTPPPQIEHLLPPPETPADVPHAAPPPDIPVALPPVAPAPAPPDALLDTAPPKPIATTVIPTPTPAPVPAPPPVAPPAPLTIDQIIKQTQPLAASAPTPAPALVAASGNVVVQLASVTDQAGAQSMMKNLQRQYAAQLGGVSLHVTRADLGARGVFYRIQSQGLTTDAAVRLCASLKKINAGCILVHP